MRKLICALIGAAALVASAATYIQTSSTGTAPWRPVKDSVSQAHLADSALHAPPSAYADSSRASGLADSAKRAGWAPLDTGRVRGIVGDTATTLRTYIGSASTTGNAATATKLATARTIATSGDVTGTPTAFDGTANITIPTALPTLLTAGSAGSATAVPTLTWDAKGRLTAVGSAAISIPHTQISDWGSYVSTAAIGALPYSWVSGAVDFDNIASKAAGAYPIWGTTSYSNAPLGLAVNNGGGMLWQGFGANNTEWNAQIFVDAQQDLLWYRTEGSPATWRSWHQLLTSTSSIPHTQISDWSTATSSFLTANQSISLTGAVTGSGTTSIATSFANTHLAGINQDLTTTSGPTFGQASLGAWAPGPAYAWFGAAGQNNNTNGNSGFLQANFGYVYMCAPSGAIAEIQYNGNGYLRVNSSGVSILQDAPLLSVVPPSTFTGLITANGGISGNLTGTASNASALGGVAADNFVQGNGDQPWGTRTTRLPGSPTALTQGLKSGFYDNDGVNSSGTPTGGWCHMIVNAHTGSTPKNQYQWELASGFWDGEIYSRTISLGAVGAWKTLIHSDNYYHFNNFINGLTAASLVVSGDLKLPKVMTIPSGTTNITPVAGLVIPFSCTNYANLSTIKFGSSVSIFFRNYSGSGITDDIGDQIAVNGAVGINVNGATGSFPARVGIIYCLSTTAVLVLL